ncbi:calcium-binding protein [Allorhodopirellula heiligendammensis]|uniref:Calcium binding protein n=1 Tax=Allorhodopirellula heiligendammensis TaxID=2714739 RepID=A0A5C6C1U2_9BACT|nr:calcium-binding protein [Allorhodopirellula heiligendammensis]TWU17957.1 Calcium binding protein [Allorhodopirellula heiligendammensis]
MKTIEIRWLSSLDPGEIEEVKQEATVDCYDEQEQCSGSTEMAGQELAFPFAAEVLGKSVEVVDTAHPKYDAMVLDLVVVHNGKRYAVAAHNVELLEPLPDGHLFLAA